MLTNGEDYIREHLAELMETGQQPSGMEGCQKLSLKMLEEMGKMGVSKMEFNTLIWLACNQNNHGIAYCNVHMLMEGIGISDSYFPGIFYKLRDKGLISFSRTAGWRENKDGIYTVRLLYNSFCGDYSNTRYIRLGHGVFRSEKFYDLPVSGKYIILMAMYELRYLSTNDFKSKGNGAVALNYWLLFNMCHKWSVYSTRTVTEAFRRVKRAFHCKMGRNFDNEGGKSYQAFLISFEKKDLLFTYADNYSHYNNLVCAAFEEEGLHISEMLGKQENGGHAASLIIRHEGKAKKRLEKAKAEYKKAMLIRHGQNESRCGKGTKGEYTDIRKYSAPLCNIINKTVSLARKFNVIPNAGTVGRWDFHPVKSTVIKNTGIALWFRYLVSEAVSAFRWTSSMAKYKNIGLGKIDLKNTVAEFMNMLLLGKADSFGYVVKKNPDA